jgi:hypothetical protein
MRYCFEKSILAKQINDSIYLSPCTNSLEYIVILSDLFVSDIQFVPFNNINTYLGRFVSTMRTYTPLSDIGFNSIFHALTSANLQWCFPTLIGSLYVGFSVKEQTGNLDSIAVVIWLLHLTQHH